MSVEPKPLVARLRRVSWDVEAHEAADEIERLRAALKQGADWFIDYAAQHNAKGTPEGYAKAATNLERARILLEARGPDA